MTAPPAPTSHTAVAIADAVAAEINSAPLSIAATAIRRYVARHDPGNLSTLQVDVVPAELDETLLDRSSIRRTAIIDVGVLRRVSGSATVEQIDPIIEVAREIADRFRFKAFDWGRNIAVQHYLFDVDDLDKRATIKTVLRLTFAVRGAK